jgi:heme exporter protein B
MRVAQAAGGRLAETGMRQRPPASVGPLINQTSAVTGDAPETRASGSPPAAEPLPSRGPGGGAAPHRDDDPRPPGFARTVAALMRKELLVELRTLESVPGMSLFAVTVFVIFHFALNRTGVNGDEASGILWVTLLLAAMLGINRLFVADAEEGGFDGFLLAPVDRSALLVAKALALLSYLVVLELVAVPAFALLLLEPSLGPALPDLPGVLLLGDLGIALIGTLVGAIAVRTRARDLLGPLLALPLLVPVVIGGARATAPLLTLTHQTGPSLRWPLMLALYDLVFGLIAYAVFDFLLED